MARNYWLVKTEPDCYNIDQLVRDKRTGWGGVRNYQARNFMRDGMKVGDGVLFYHSSCEPPHVAGIARVSKPAHPDPTQFDPKDDHYDPKSQKDDPQWMQVELEFVEKFADPVSLDELRSEPALAKMRLLQRGNRLSVMPVEASEWELVLKLGGAKKG